MRELIIILYVLLVLCATAAVAISAYSTPCNCACYFRAPTTQELAAVGLVETQ